MASFNNITVSGTSWIDLNTTSGCPVGTEIQIQNISSSSVLIQESTLAPANDNGAIIFDPSFGDLSKAVVGAGSLKIWVKAVNPNFPAKLAIYE